MDEGGADAHSQQGHCQCQERRLFVCLAPGRQRRDAIISSHETTCFIPDKVGAAGNVHVASFLALA